VYKRQKYIDRIVPFIDKPVIKVITGMRRTGKSTIMIQLADHLKESGVGSEKIIYINMESLDNSRFLDIHELHRFVREQKIKAGGKIYLFIDEVQEIPDWEKAVNSFFADDDADIFVTGSNSKLLSGELATLLAGRYVEFNVYPLVFSEFSEVVKNKSEIIPRFNQFLKYGGMPGIHHLEFEEPNIYQYLSSIRDSVVLKDVVSRNNIRDIDLLDKIIAFVFDNAGHVMSSRKIAEFFKNERRSVGHETIINYLNYLESAFIIKRVPRYDLKGKKLLETNEKIYLTDIGLRHTLFGYREKDINLFLENIVFIELKARGYDVKIGKIDDFEVDFIAERGGERIYVQVCYLLTDETVRNRETRPFFKINDNFPKYLLTMDTVPESSENGIIRRYIPDWLMEQK
jgi:hypothetical protein